jgi:muramoyltetrapeptide carboxypeptidase
MAVNPLRTGDRIALIAPSSPFRPDKFTQACEGLKERGYQLVPGTHVFNSKKYLSAPDSERACDLIDAICDPAISAVICIRGGYGSGRLLPWLPFSSLERNRKILLGYSDITFLHLAFLTHMQWVTFHGPNLMDMADDPRLMNEVLKALGGNTDFRWELQDSQILRHGAVAGKLIGGNLSCMVHLIGTPYFPDLRGALLLIEDRGEALYRLDRFFTQMRLSGVLQRLGGLILGQFTDCGEVQDVWEMILEYVRPFSFPVICNLPFGHGPGNQVIPIGIQFFLSTHEKVFKTIECPFAE